MFDGVVHYRRIDLRQLCRALDDTRFRKPHVPVVAELLQDVAQCGLRAQRRRAIDAKPPS